MPLGLFTDELFILEREPLGAVVEIEGEFDRYFFEKPDSNFIIGQFTTSNYDDFVVVGNVPFVLNKGRSYVVSGEITEREDKFSGVMQRQLRLKTIVVLEPKGEAQITKFVGSITGRTIAPMIYDKYGEETLNILKTDPERVSNDFRGVSLETAERLQGEVLEALAEISVAFPFLQNYGFSVEEVESMIRNFGESIKGMVEKNPYMLMNNLNGLPGASFPKCDAIAQDIGFDLTDKRRIKAGIEYSLVREGSFGHVYFYLEDVVASSLKILNKPKGINIRSILVEETVEELIIEGVLHFDSAHRRVYLKRYYNYEKGTAFNLVSLLEQTEWVPLSVREDILDEYLEERDIELEDKQRQAVLEFTRTKAGVGVINGGAGTGKTFTLNIFVDIMYQLYQLKFGRAPHIQLMAPTGKAAKVMRNATGMEATTIHRALQWTEEGFRHNQSNPLSGDIIVVDEASMLDTSLSYRLTEAIRQGTKLILLGDPNQLPSIGPGNVLHDIVDSGRFDTVTLDVTKRQEGDSQVALNGQLIAGQKLPEKDPNPKQPKAITKTKATPDGLLDQAIKGLKYLLHIGVDLDDIQVITPGRKGVTGVYNMNYVLQNILNPPKGDMEVLNRSFVRDGQRLELNFRVGDRVIHTTNTDKLKWVRELKNGKFQAIEGDENDIITNGEIGKVHAIYEETYETQSKRKQTRKILIIKYDDGLVRYTTDDKRDLDHAYAMTIHKSQGSQWEAVIQLISTEHYIMLDNSLLYTGYTRAEEYQVLLADKRALGIALNTRKTFERRTSLKERIMEETI